MSAQFPRGTTCPQALLTKDVTGQVILITGASAGIGLCLATQLAKQGATVVMACRNPDKTQKCVQEIKAQCRTAVVETIALDLTDLDSVRKCATEFKARFPKLDVLMNNAGVMALPKKETTKQGFEMQIGTNHIGHFLLTELLLDHLKLSAPSRIINVSSSLHYQGRLLGAGIEDLNWEKRSYSPWGAYGASKLANVLYSRQLARRLKGTGVTAVSMHPGIVSTELLRYQPGWVVTLRDYVLQPVGLWVDVWAGTQTSLYCCLAPELEEGAFYNALCKGVKAPNTEALSEALQDRLYELSKAAVGL